MTPREEIQPQPGDLVYHARVVHYADCSRIVYDAERVAGLTPKGFRLADGRWFSCRTRRWSTTEEAALARARARMAAWWKHEERRAQAMRRASVALEVEVPEWAERLQCEPFWGWCEP